jgi:hypothetical protein
MSDSTSTQILIVSHDSLINLTMAIGGKRLISSQAGSVAAFTVDLLVYPLDTIKTRWQSQDYSKAYTAAAQSSRKLSPQLFKGLYQGVGSVIIATLPAGELPPSFPQKVKQALI